MTLSIESKITTLVVRSKNQVSADLKGDAVIYNFVDGKYFCLNSVGTRIWRLIEQPVSVEKIFTTIQDEYLVDENQCHADIVQLLDKLNQAGLVEFISKSENIL